MSSRQPRKQRKYRYNAPQHRRRKMISASLDKSLRKSYGRSVPVRKGDDVKIMRGEFRGKTGKVSRTDTKKMKIYIENIKVKKANQQEVPAPIDPSNVMIMKLNLDDKMRKKAVSRRRGEKL
ncbi:MAG: 50S ribosomal protein L24 [Candidatus Aenigmarchaeota archaeon]|nr:50S ribosomal protein L24 [Candidatus Aenigmarchaeota archaeon]